METAFPSIEKWSCAYAYVCLRARPSIIITIIIIADGWQPASRATCSDRWTKCCDTWTPWTCVCHMIRRFAVRKHEFQLFCAVCTTRPALRPAVRFGSGGQYINTLYISHNIPRLRTYKNSLISGTHHRRKTKTTTYNEHHNNNVIIPADISRSKWMTGHRQPECAPSHKW